MLGVKETTIEARTFGGYLCRFFHQTEDDRNVLLEAAKVAFSKKSFMVCLRYSVRTSGPVLTIGARVLCAHVAAANLFSILKFKKKHSKESLSTRKFRDKMITCVCIHRHSQDRSETWFRVVTAISYALSLIFPVSESEVGPS